MRRVLLIILALTLLISIGGCAADDPLDGSLYITGRFYSNGVEIGSSDVFTESENGLVPAPDNVTGACLMDNGTWQIPNGSINIWSDGIGAPSGGNNGDYYLDNSTSDVYTKISDNWTITANIKGEQGIQGPQGIQGVQGNTGAQGIQGIQGIQGATGAQGVAGPNEVTTSTNTDLTGLIKGNGSTISTATAGTDYTSPSTLRDDNLQYTYPLWCKEWSNTDGFTASNSGTASAVTTGFVYLTLSTGTSNGGYAKVYSGTGYFYENAYTACDLRMKVRGHTSNTTTNATIWIGFFETPASPTTTQRHIGFKIVNGTISATTGDGTTETAEAFTETTWNQYSMMDFYIKQVSGTVTFYLTYGASTWSKTITTHLPDDNRIVYPSFYIINSTTANKTFELYPIIIYEGSS